MVTKFEQIAKIIVDWAVAHPQLGAALLGALIPFVLLGPTKAAGRRAIEALNHYRGRRHSLSTYLDWIIGNHRFLRMLPSTLIPMTENVHHQELDNLYVSLALMREQTTPEEITLKRALQESDRLVILGDPGAGKTTLLTFLALTLARAARNGSSVTDHKVRKAELECVRKTRSYVSADLGLSRYPVPIFSYLNRYHDVATWPEQKNLIDAVRDDWKSIDSLRGSSLNLTDALQRGQCIFLLDGFDELGTQAAREAIAEKIGEAAATYTSCRFIVTSRIIGYSGQLAKYGFRV